MKLQTQIPLQKQANNLIDYDSNVLLLGSCFVENIGVKLEYFKFQNLINPFGILFHPLAIEKLIHNSTQKKEYTEEDIFFHNERWHCYDVHSKLSNISKDNLLKDLNANIELTNQQIQQSTHIIITLGTAWVYKHKETDSIVANCHKVPQKKFSKELLSEEELQKSITHAINLIKRINTEVIIIFTISPVRHLKDGFVENAQSKSHLIAAMHKVLKSEKRLYYFPSYEIMMDELRDYRFYAEDMIHPNATTINYVWERFQHVWISEAIKKTMEDVDEIQKGLLHKPFNPNSEAHQKFLEKLESKKQKIKSLYPNIVF